MRFGFVAGMVLMIVGSAGMSESETVTDGFAVDP